MEEKQQLPLKGLTHLQLANVLLFIALLIILKLVLVVLNHL